MNKKRFACITVILVLMTGIVFMSGCSKDDDGESDDSKNKIAKITYGSVTDQNGNTCKTVIIGTQTWMAENLKVTTYNDGTLIPNVTDDDTWANLTTAAQCTYNNTTNADTIARYGRLYNWYAVDSASNGSKNICPKGWHVPSNAEWDTLQTYLIANGYNNDGTTTGNKIAKSLADTTGWNTSEAEEAIGNNPLTNNSSGFSALPGGYRYGITGNYNNYNNFGNYSGWWSSSADDLRGAYKWYLYYIYSDLIGQTDDEQFGFSVRCVKD